MKKTLDPRFMLIVELIDRYKMLCRESAEAVLKRISREQEWTFTLNYSEYCLFSNICNADGQLHSLIEHAKKLSANSSTVTRYVKALEGYGLIAKENDPADDRKYMLRATAFGLEVIDVLRDQLYDNVNHYLQDVTDLDYDHTISFLNKCILRLEME